MKPSRPRELTCGCCRHSPDLNPIELAFAKLKALLRREMRSVDALWSALGSIVARFTPAECANYSDTQAIPSQGEDASRKRRFYPLVRSDAGNVIPGRIVRPPPWVTG